MNIEKIIGVVGFMLMGIIFVIGRKSFAYDALMRNIFKPVYDQKRLKIYEIIYLVFGITFMVISFLILFYG